MPRSTNSINKVLCSSLGKLLIYNDAFNERLHNENDGQACWKASMTTKTGLNEDTLMMRCIQIRSDYRTYHVQHLSMSRVAME